MDGHSSIESWFTFLPAPHFVSHQPHIKSSLFSSPTIVRFRSDGDCFMVKAAKCEQYLIISYSNGYYMIFMYLKHLMSIGTKISTLKDC